MTALGLAGSQRDGMGWITETMVGETDRYAYFSLRFYPGDETGGTVDMEWVYEDSDDIEAMWSGFWTIQTVLDGPSYVTLSELTGLPSAKALWADILGCKPEECFIGGNASLTLMYDTISKAYTHGLLGTRERRGASSTPSNGSARPPAMTATSRSRSRSALSSSPSP